MNSSFSGDFNATQTASGSGAASQKRAEGIVPVFIKQLLETAESSFSLFGMNFGIVYCAAIIRSVEKSSTKITYLLEDHTGQIEGHYWLEDGDDADKLVPNVMINTYAMVYGSLRSQSNQKTMMIFRLLPIKSPNEVCTHGLEVLNARFKAEQFSTKSNEDFGSGSTSGTVGGINAGDNSSSREIISGLDSKHRALFDAVRNHMSSNGISRDELKKKFQHITPKELSALLDFLISEGHIYSSIDSDHFLVTE